MSSEEQDEEREVIMSIYEGDPAFNQKSPITFQYKYGEDGHFKSFLLELCWGPEYPQQIPEINLTTFYNKHLLPSVREKIIDHIKNEAQELIGSPMTYSIFESVREHFETLTADQVPVESKNEEDDEDKGGFIEQGGSRGKEKKEQLTKAQKRKQWDRVNSKGEKPRGWNWVDVVHHLGQTGAKDKPLPAAVTAHDS